MRVVKRLFPDFEISRLEWLALFALIGADFAIVSLHAVLKIYSEITGAAFPETMSLASPIGPGATWNYGKFLIVSLLLFSIGQNSGGKLYFFFGLIFFILLLDDFFEVHDNLGYAVGIWIGENALNPQDRGEPFVFVALLLLVIVLMWLGTRGAGTRERRIGWSLISLGFLLAFFGVGVDQLRSLSPFLDGMAREIYSGLLLLVEEGGELVSMTLVLWFVLVLFRNSA